jgi:hypothetical protein
MVKKNIIWPILDSLDWWGERITSRTIFSVLAIFSFFVFMGSFYILSGITPNHDSIEWAGASHYFYSSVAEGIIPYWNPYSQCGTPFFVNFQSFGLLEPSQFIFALIQKLIHCTTLTTYLLHYLFCYFIFIIGAFFLIAFLTKNRRVAFFFSIVLLLAVFPMYGRQNATILSFFMIPFLFLALLRFFETEKKHQKGILLFATSLLLAFSLHVYIPIGAIFYFLLFVAAAFVFKIAEIQGTLRFLLSKAGFFWVFLSAVVFLMVCAPVLALYQEFYKFNELLPTVRFLQKNGQNLVRLFATDLPCGIFAQGLTNHLKVSLTWPNIIGLFWEPVSTGWSTLGVSASEVRTFCGIFPLVCALSTYKTFKNKHTRLFLTMAFATIFIACNFKWTPEALPGFTQALMMMVFPPLQSLEVLQNFGGLFVFFIIILAAIGFETIMHLRKENVVSLTLAYLPFKMVLLGGLIAYKIWLSPVIYATSGAIMVQHAAGHWLTMRQLYIIVLVISPPIFAFIFFSSPKLLSLFKQVPFKRLVQLVVLTTFLELFIFILFYTNVNVEVLYRKYHDISAKGRLFDPKRSGNFLDFRKAFSAPPIFFNSFFGYDIYEETKSAFPNIVRNFFLLSGGKQLVGDNTVVTAPWDHFYMTRYYYDYLANVSLDRQLAISSVTRPILDFYPSKNVIFLQSKYDVVERLNSQPPREQIYIEKNPAIRHPNCKPSDFYKPENYFKLSPNDTQKFEAALDEKSFQNSKFEFTLEGYDANTFSLSVSVLEDGHLYYGDGYSRHWKAYVDDRLIQIQKTNINFKSVPINAGSHRVKFVYDPKDFKRALHWYFVGLGIATIILTVGGGYILKNEMNSRRVQR